MLITTSRRRRELQSECQVTIVQGSHGRDERHLRTMRALSRACAQILSALVCKLEMCSHRIGAAPTSAATSRQRTDVVAISA